MDSSKAIKIFAFRLNELRVYNGLSQEGLAKKIGISKGAISYYESGQRVPDIATLSDIADCFEVSTDYLLGKTNLPSKNSDADIKAVIKLINETNTDIARLLVKYGELASALHINK